MCTVTFIPYNNRDFILTSNRDEAPERETKLPKIYTKRGVELLYPKDVLAGGTWIGASSLYRLVNLMNGGFKPHQRKPHYRKSRGLIVKDLLIASTVEDYLDSEDFTEIEPFTAIVINWSKQTELIEIVWDGITLHKNHKPHEIPHIWSSSPLYTEEYKQMRRNWFQTFLESNEITPKNVMHFHRTGGDGNPDSNLIMDRGFVKTKSITQIERLKREFIFDYYDLQTGKDFKHIIDI